MRIAQIAPLHEAVPPKFYGGAERVVSYRPTMARGTHRPCRAIAVAMRAKCWIRTRRINASNL